MHVRGLSEGCRCAIRAAFSSMQDFHGAFTQHYINASIDTRDNAVESAFGQITLHHNAIDFLLNRNLAMKFRHHKRSLSSLVARRLRRFRCLRLLWCFRFLDLRLFGFFWCLRCLWLLCGISRDLAIRLRWRRAGKLTLFLTWSQRAFRTRRRRWPRCRRPGRSGRCTRPRWFTGWSVCGNFSVGLGRCRTGKVVAVAWLWWCGETEAG